MLSGCVPAGRGCGPVAAVAGAGRKSASCSAVGNPAETPASGAREVVPGIVDRLVLACRGRVASGAVIAAVSVAGRGASAGARDRDDRPGVLAGPGAGSTAVCVRAVAASVVSASVRERAGDGVAAGAGAGRGMVSWTRPDCRAVSARLRASSRTLTGSSPRRTGHRLSGGNPAGHQESGCRARHCAGQTGLS